jgi:hypothetical protein
MFDEPLWLEKRLTPDLEPRLEEGKMSRVRSRAVILSLMLVSAAAIVAATPARAGESAYDGEWHYNLNVYGWLPGIDGTLNYDIPGSDDTISVDADALLENLGFVAMTTFAVQKNKWLVAADLIYVKEKGDKSESVSVPWDDNTMVNVGAELDLDMWVISLAGGYEFARTDRAVAQFLFGARYIALDADMTLNIDGPLPGTLPTRNFGQSASIFDGIVGIRGRLGGEEGFFVPYYLDMGAGSSEFTWQGMTGIGYDWHWGGVMAAYRYVYINEGEQYFLEDIALSGLAVGIHFKW